jgi:hypothetical protein
VLDRAAAESAGARAAAESAGAVAATTGSGAKSSAAQRAAKSRGIVPSEFGECRRAESGEKLLFLANTVPEERMAFSDPAYGT